VTYLLDTNILAETRKRHPAASVVSWLAATAPDRLHISTLTFGEIEQGITQIRSRGDHQQAAALEGWIQALEARFTERTLPVTLRIAIEWGRHARSQPLPIIDSLIAATARVHGLTVVTRNVKDFERAGVEVLNPFTE